VVGITRLFLSHDRGGPVMLISADVAQVTPGLLPPLLRGLYADELVIAVERFVVGPRAARSTTAEAGAVTREVVAQVRDWARDKGLTCHQRSAAEVKPWASDERLTSAGIWVPRGMRHAKDAARHALYCAVKDYGLSDPLSRRAGRSA
jgi:hypothetical protein